MNFRQAKIAEYDSTIVSIRMHIITLANVIQYCEKEGFFNNFLSSHVRVFTEAALDSIIEQKLIKPILTSTDAQSFLSKRGFTHHKAPKLSMPFKKLELDDAETKAWEKFMEGKESDESEKE